MTKNIKVTCTKPNFYQPKPDDIIRILPSHPVYMTHYVRKIEVEVEEGELLIHTREDYVEAT
jgi:hypothetical protein